MAGTLVSRFSIVLPGSGGPSRTAMLTAAARALHREEPPPWVLDDPVALEFAGESKAPISAIGYEWSCRAKASWHLSAGYVCGLASPKASLSKDWPRASTNTSS